MKFFFYQSDLTLLNNGILPKIPLYPQGLRNVMSNPERTHLSSVTNDVILQIGDRYYFPPIYFLGTITIEEVKQAYQKMQNEAFLKTTSCP